MIKFDRVGKHYKTSFSNRSVIALQDLSLHVSEGEVFGFLGPNGAGKSTTIKILLNLIYPTFGAATIMDQDVCQSSIRDHVGFLPENPYFYDYLTARELLWFGGKAAGMAAKDIRIRTEHLLTKVGLVKDQNRHLRTYSKGMVQRAGLAFALIHNPEVVIFDEPMSGLDPMGRKMVGDLILELKAEGKTVFFSSHILTDIERFCDRAGIIVSGRLRLVDHLDQLVSEETTLEDVFLEQVAKVGEEA